MATTFTVNTQPSSFLWATGIEDTFVPQSKPGHRALDEYELMGHYEHWRTDLALARTLGVRTVRWGAPWYRIEPEPGVFDWRWTDEVLPYLADELGIVPIVDLMHYGCPFWLQGEFSNPAYPQAVAAYAAAFCRRYRQLVHWYTPLNEPLVNAAMCGRAGIWPPYLHGEDGYTVIMLQLMRGILATVESIRHINPGAMLVHVEAAGLSRSAHPDLEAVAEEHQLHRFLSFDLLTGTVNAQHPLFPWLLRHGASVDELAWIVAHAVTPDIMGLNFYPQWSTEEWYWNERGGSETRVTEPEGDGFAELLRTYWERYRAPVMITETSAFGSDEVRAAWLQRSVGIVKQLRGESVPIVGYTWFPLTTMIDWAYRTGSDPLERYRLELGLYRLTDPGFDDRWQPTPLAAQFAQYIADPAGSIASFRVADSSPAGSRTR